MTFQLLPAAAVTLLLIVTSLLIVRRRENLKNVRAVDRLAQADSASTRPEPTILLRNLGSALPNSVIFSYHKTAFQQSKNAYWAQQESEVVPACVVRPRDVHEVSTAVAILASEYDRRKQDDEKMPEGLFAVRSGGHSPVSGSASIQGGVLIDLSLICEVTPSEDGSSVVIGSGAKLMDVSQVLDAEGLAVVAGRNSHVGVGGSSLGGGLSFFSPRFGLICSNISSYEIVLASGAIATASATTNPDLWRALKGGSNNFGIVTRFTVYSFPCSKIWSGFIYLPAFQTTKVLASFHEFVSRADSDESDTLYDNYAAGPIACFSYMPKIGVQIVAVNLVYTKVPENENKWPACWKSSGFAFLWRIWSTCTVRTLTSATDEMTALNPSGRRQVFATTTIKNDLATIAAAHAAYSDAFASIRQVSVKGLLWTLVMQPLLSDWVGKGDPNPLGLDDCTRESLIIVSFTVNWDEARDDHFVKSTTRSAIEQIDAFAKNNSTGHRYRYVNYCAEWQRPFEGYGKENLRFLRDVSRRYDARGLFQEGCKGGFKLGLVDGEA